MATITDDIVGAVRTLRPPRVAESPVHFECRVVRAYEVGTNQGRGAW